MNDNIKEVIRVEHKESGLGFWNHHHNGFLLLKSHSCFRDIFERHNNTEQFPPFRDDNKLKSQISYTDVQRYHFAFKNLQQLSTGFTNEELKELIIDFGFVVYAYTVVDYFESDYQVVFKKDTAINKKDLSFMFL